MWKDRNIDQWNRIEGTEIYQHIYEHLVFDKGTNAIQWRKGSLFNNSAVLIGYQYETKWTSEFTSYHTQKWTWNGS